MRILTISAQKPDSTGSGVYLASLAGALSNEGHDIGVIAGVSAADACSLECASYVRLVRFDSEELPFHVFGMSDEMPYPSSRYRDMTTDQLARFEAAFRGALDEAMAEFRPDVVLCHHLYLVTAIVREQTDLPVFAVCHSTDIRQMRSHGLERERIVSAIRSLDGVLALHEEQAGEIIACYGVDPRKVTVVGTGFDDAVFSRGEKPARERMASGDALRDRNAAEAREPVNLVYVGKISRKKGVGSLLDAIALLRDESVAVRCTCVGGHGEAGEYDELAARAASLGGAVEFAGRLPQEELVRVYRAADVFVLPSFYEGLPLVVVEALACGCRVAMSDLPGVRPWLAARVPYAPVAFIDLPRMIGVDEPDPADLPAFAERVKAGILEAASLPPCTLDLSALSWRGLARRVGELLEGARCPESAEDGRGGNS